MAENTLNMWLYENYITEDPNDYYAKPKFQNKFSNRDIARQIVEGGSEIKEDTIFNILEQGDKMKAHRLAQGHIIDTPFCLAKAGTSGAYHSPTEKFNKESHKLYANYVQGSAVREELSKVNVDILGVAESGTYIGKVTDTLTKAVNSTITPGNVLQIEGNKLKVAGETAEVGVWFINTQDETRTQVAQIITNEPKKLMIMIPKLTKGTYELEVITLYSSGGNLLKKPRIADFEHILTVN